MTTNNMTDSPLPAEEIPQPNQPLYETPADASIKT